MKRTHGNQAVVMMIALGALITSCEQPKIRCTTGHGGFAVTYTLKPGSKTGEGDCDTLRGAIIGLEKYNPTKPGNEEEQDPSKARLAIRASEIGEIVARAMTATTAVDIDSSVVSSFGDFASADPDENDICTVPSLTAAELKVPEFEYEYEVGDPPMTVTDTQPATEIRYEWSNVRVYVTPFFPGTQMVADLTYTKDGCSASYSVVGVWPAVSCAAGEGDKVDPALCDPQADPEGGRLQGSGINPDLEEQITCDPETALCVLREPPPELR